MPRVPRPEILKGHKRQGKRFIPPLMQLGAMRETSYVKDQLPHLIWMGLLNDRLGFRDGVRIAVALATHAAEVHKAPHHVNFALCGRYVVLTPEEQAQVIDRAKLARQLVPLRRALAPLVGLYPTCPLAFLGEPAPTVPRPVQITEMQRTLSDHLDKYAQKGMVLQASLIAIRASTGGLFFAPDMSVPDFNVLIEAPESEAAKKAGSFVRATALTEWSTQSTENLEEWARTFWNQSYTLSPCQLIPDEIDD